MFDIVVLIIIPMIITGMLSFFISLWNNRLYGSNNLFDRIINVSRQPRRISDNNHKEFCIEELMVREDKESFVQEYNSLFGNNIKGLNNN